PNSAMSLGVPDLWGYDASVVRRYAEFVAWSQGGDPNKATQDVNFASIDPLFAMVRLRYVLLSQTGNSGLFEVGTSPLPHVLFVSKYRIANDRDSIFNSMRAPDFDPSNIAILESEPSPAPVATETLGHAQIISESTDTLTIEASTEQPAILLITDVFTPSGRAISLPGSSQSIYRLQPANYILRAVPLAAGHHRLRIEYSSLEFQLGKWISIGSILLFVGAVYRFRHVKLGCTRTTITAFS